MRIFYAVSGTPSQTSLPGSTIWHTNLYLPLLDLGHDVVVFQYDFSDVIRCVDHTRPEQQEYIAQHRPRFSEELLRQVKAAHQQKPIDLFFSYFYSAYVEPAAIREIGNMGITTANWYCNASFQFHLVEEIAPAYHYCLAPEKFRLEDYRRAGANPIYCQEAANPNVYKPYDLPRAYDVTFVGARYGSRPMYLNRLLAAGFDARAWGPNWRQPWGAWLRYRARRTAWCLLRGQRPTYPDDVPPSRCGPPLSDEELIKMYSRSKISLGFSAVAEVPADGPPIKQVRLRDFEAPMSGAFYLVEHFDELTEFFEPDKEIVCFHDADELVDKARYYLEHEAERERIRQAGLRRARAEHTWHKRFEMAFAQMGLR